MFRFARSGSDCSSEGCAIQRCHRQVAILCNHQKTVSKAAESMFETLNEKLNTLKEQRDELVKWKGYVKAKKESKIPLRADDKDVIDAIHEKVTKAQKKKDAAKTDEQKLDATDALEKAKNEAKLVSDCDQHAALSLSVV